MNPQIITPDFPVSRPRRLRRDDYTRRLVRENALTVNDLIYPVFVAGGNGLKQAVPSLPGVVRYSLDTLLPVAEECVALGIPVLSLFPAIDPALKTPDGIEATNPDGLIPRVVRELKKRFPDLGVLCDVALDPYTSHGQDGVIDENGRQLLACEWDNIQNTPDGYRAFRGEEKHSFAMQGGELIEIDGAEAAD